jgi:Cu-Zn family superoxide dismutase
MRFTTFSVLAASAAAGLLLQGCMSDGTVKADAGKIGRATLSNASGEMKARATVTETASGLTLAVTATGLAAGQYGIHVHTTGKCDAPDFATAGGHWNPGMKQHGKDNPAGEHMGDLPNLVIGADGSGTLETTIAGGKLASGAAPLFDADGAAIVIHAKADDYKTDPSGNSGGRVLCGVFMPG